MPAYIVHIVIGFFLSALFHSVSAAATSNDMVTVGNLASDIFIFFGLQILGIMIEMVVAKLVTWRSQSAGDIKPVSIEIVSHGGIGYLWVLCWLAFSSWWFVRAYSRLGIANWKF